MQEAPPLVRLYNLVNIALAEESKVARDNMCNQQSSLMAHEYLRGQLFGFETAIETIRKVTRKLLKDDEEIA